MNQIKETVINKKSSHFNLGKLPDNAFTIYQRDYVRKKLQQQQSMADQLAIKKSHFQIGNPNLKCFETTNTSDLKNWGIVRSNVDENSLKQIRKHHFNMGNNWKGNCTTNQLYYDKKDFDISKTKIDSDQYKRKMRSHNHHFNENQKRPRVSSYTQQYRMKQVPYNPVSKKQVPSSSIVLGNQKNIIPSTMKSHYGPKIPQPNIVHTNNYSNLKFGDNNSDFITTNAMYHNQKPPSYIKIDQKLKNQLKATHFQLGGYYQTIQSQFGANYLPFKGNLIRPQLSKIQGSHFTLGNQRQKFSSQTTNKRELPPRIHHQAVFIRNKVRDTISNINLGNQGNNYSTQFGSNFLPKNENAKNVKIAGLGKVDEGNEGILMGDGRGTYCTQQRDCYKCPDISVYKERQLGKRQQIVGQLLQGAGRDLITEYMDQYRNDKQNKYRQFHSTSFKI